MSTPGHPPVAGHPVWSVPKGVTHALTVLATVLLLAGIVAVWANRVLLNADNWSSTSTQLLQNQAVRSAVANYLVDQLYANVNVSGAVRDALPKQLDPLADPIAGALRSGAVSVTEEALSRPLIQSAWAAANRIADNALIDIVEGGGPRVSVQGGEVTLNLRVILNEVANRLGISADLGSKLPASAGQLTIMRSDQIGLVQTLGRTLRGLALALYIVVPLLYVLIFVTARGRRARTLRTIGISWIVAGLAAILVRSLLVSQIPNSLVHDAGVRPAASAVVSIATNMLVEIAGAVILVGAVMILSSWLAGTSRPATRIRRVLAPHFRDQPAVMFAAAGGLLLLVYIWQPIPATGQPIGMLVFAVLAALGVDALRRQSIAEYTGVRVPHDAQRSIAQERQAATDGVPNEHPSGQAPNQAPNHAPSQGSQPMEP